MSAFPAHCSRAKVARLTAFVVAAMLTFVTPALAEQRFESPTGGYAVEGNFVYCPDGSKRELQGIADPAKAAGNVEALRFVCENSDQIAKVAPQPAPLPDPKVTADGTIICPDGTTRPGFASSDDMGRLSASIACSKQPGAAAPTSAAMEAKNRDIAIADAREGRAGLWESIKTAWETGDSMLIAYLAGKFAAFAAIVALVLWLLRRKAS